MEQVVATATHGYKNALRIGMIMNMMMTLLCHETSPANDE
jgi:hypothetical protein